jgi:hypothetical protein
MRLLRQSNWSLADSLLHERHVSPASFIVDARLEMLDAIKTAKHSFIDSGEEIYGPAYE